MAYITSTHTPSSERLSVLGSLSARIAAARDSFAEYRRKREIYLRTLRELQSYRPHELRDLRIQADDIEELARQQAGW